MLGRAIGRFGTTVAEIVTRPSRIRLSSVGPAQRTRLGRTRVHRSDRTRATAASARRGVRRVLVIRRLIARLIGILIGGTGRQHGRSGCASAQAGALGSRQSGAR